MSKKMKIRRMAWLMLCLAFSMATVARAEDGAPQALPQTASQAITQALPQTTPQPSFIPDSGETPSCAASPRGERRLYLQVGLGAGRDLYRDLGTSPLSYTGPALLPEAGLLWERPLWQFGLNSRSSFGIYRAATSTIPSMDALGLNNWLSFRALRKKSALHLLVPQREEMLLYGLSVDNLLSVKYNSHHQNASVGLSDFVSLGLHGRYEFLLRRNDCSRKFYRVFVELLLQPVSLVFRPGYAYIDDYTSRNEVAATLGSSYQCHMRIFSGIGTGIGLSRTFLIGHRMTLAYHWSFMNNGEKKGWKYQTALHSLSCTFDINLKHEHIKI